MTTRIRLPNNWEPRDYQLPLWSYLQGGGLRADVAAHRRWGKDEVALHWTATQMVQRPGSYWHMLPEASQARKAIWDAVNPHTGLRRIDEAFPPALRETTREQDMFIRFKNGATWQVVGSDNYNSLVGSPPVGVIFSEWSIARPDAWTYMRPILAENGGWAVFLWTPRGRNHATRAFEARETDADWFTLRSPASDTSVFTRDQLDKERQDLIVETGSQEEGEARFRQEYMVDFNVATPGSYYGSLIGAAEAAEPSRFRRGLYDPSVKVETSWDLGIDDYTAIWFFQQVATEVRAIDYYEVGGEGLQSIVREAIASKPYVYGTHYLPHDVQVRELGNSGKSRLQTLNGLGLTNVNVGVPTDPEERINAGRQLIPVTWFDVDKCAQGIERLRNYKKRWNAALGTYTGPLHDQNSHGADAWGEFAMNRKISRLATPRGRPRPTTGGWMV
jgi:phage terminase large subunit